MVDREGPASRGQAERAGVSGLVRTIDPSPVPRDPSTCLDRLLGSREHLETNDRLSEPPTASDSFSRVVSEAIGGYRSLSEPILRPNVGETGSP